MTVNDLKIGLKIKLNDLEGEIDWIGNDKFRFKYADPLSGYWIKDFYSFDDLDKFKKVVENSKNNE